MNEAIKNVRKKKKKKENNCGEHRPVSRWDVPSDKLQCFEKIILLSSFKRTEAGKNEIVFFFTAKKLFPSILLH